MTDKSASAVKVEEKGEIRIPQSASPLRYFKLCEPAEAPRLWFFNPDTDYALASGSPWYTPPAKIRDLQIRGCLCPRFMATPDRDLILTPPGIGLNDLKSLEGWSGCSRLNLRLITPSDLKNDPERENYIPTPWGWNAQVYRWFKELLGEGRRLKQKSEITMIRNLSHRRTTIEILEKMRPFIDGEIEMPSELGEIESVMDQYAHNRNIYLKAPWSSSGRGVLRCEDLELKHVEPWARGIIFRQGCVMKEKAYERLIDFATEWYASDKDIRFMGYSVFKTSPRGKYLENLNMSQEALVKMIQKESKENLQDMTLRLRDALRRTISPHYSGPLGVDMLVTSAGHINPCVEVNLRHTMGMAFLNQNF